MYTILIAYREISHSKTDPPVISIKRFIESNHEEVSISNTIWNTNALDYKLTQLKQSEINYCQQQALGKEK